MCIECDGLSETIRIEHPYEYFNLVEQIKKYITSGLLSILEGNCDFNDISKGNPWTDDVISHTFKCTHCIRTFELTVETYHGSGGNWEVSNNSKSINNE